jgi:2-polyprenyl-3-methyl-5-hydroxy-6-metoxy-1,4-benzoquinol methylase
MTQQEFIAAYEALGAGINRSYDSTERQREFILDMVYGPCVLEVGCGDGRMAFEIARQGFRVWGCDVISSSLVLA